MKRKFEILALRLDPRKDRDWTHTLKWRGDPIVEFDQEDIYRLVPIEGTDEFWLQTLDMAVFEKSRYRVREV